MAQDCARPAGQDCRQPMALGRRTCGPARTRRDGRDAAAPRARRSARLHARSPTSRSCAPDSTPNCRPASARRPPTKGVVAQMRSMPCVSAATPRARARQLATADTANATTLRKRSHPSVPVANRRARHRGRYRRARGKLLALGSRHRRRRARSRRGAAGGEPQPAEGDRRQGDGPRLAGRRAARGAVPLRRRRPRLPLARRPRAPPHAASSSEVDDRPPSLQVAMRMARVEGRARSALGAAAAAGVKHMAHRFIVGETPREAHRRARGAVEATASPRASTCSARRRSRSAEADRYAGALRARRSTGSSRSTASCPERPLLEADSAGPHPAREPVGQGVGPHAAAAPRRARARQARRRRRACATLLRRARELDAHLHIDMESFDSREAVTELVLELLAEDEFRDGPSAGLVLQAYLRDSPAAVRRDPRLGRRATPRGYPLTVRLVKGAYWDHEIVEAAPARLGVAGLRGQGRLRPQLRGAHAAAARGAAGRARRRSRRTTCARSPTPSPPTALIGGDDARPRAPGPARAWATTSRRRSPARACACAPTARSATSWPAWPTWCAGCSRTRPTSPSCTSRRAGAPLDELLAAP